MDHVAINSLTRFALVSVLNECSDQLAILKAINLKNVTTLENQVVTYKNLHERYMKDAEHEKTLLPPPNVKYDKLITDINRLILLIDKTAREIQERGSFAALHAYTDAVHQMRHDDRRLIQTKLANERQASQLEKNLREQRTQGVETLKAADLKIRDLKMEIDETIVYTKVEKSHYESWENARVEQNDIQCADAERHFTTLIQETNEKITVETDCHNEFAKFVEEDRTDLLKQIADWTKLYDEELENREAKLISMKGELEEMSLRLAKVVNKYDQRCDEIKEWKAYKVARRRARAREKDVAWASLIIQTWWRAIMTRKRLGPYKAKKKGRK